MNRFDGYIGLVPVDERTGKIALAGELQLNLKNLFGVGSLLFCFGEVPPTFTIS